MIVLLLKEVREFFSSLTGYIAVIVFLLVNSLFLWILPGDLNIIDAGYASLDSFFSLAPWVFLFLIPAITMRMFAEEKRTGMLEFLMTKPLSDIQIIMAKYIGAIFLVAISILPCLVFFFSVSVLGNPPGNIDSGAIWGAFIGLFLLAAVYVAIGLLASALSENQIVSFIIAVVLCFTAYIGFDYLAQWPGLRHIDTIILNLGINEHYKSISRGVIDTRDITYYMVTIVLFLLLTKTRLQSRTW